MILSGSLLDDEIEELSDQLFPSTAYIYINDKIYFLVFNFAAYIKNYLKNHLLLLVSSTSSIRPMFN